MNAKHYEAVLEVFNDDSENGIIRVLDRYSMSVKQLSTAIDDVFSGNDIEGAAIGIAAVDLTYPDQEVDEYFEAVDRILNNRCPLLRLHTHADFPPELQSRAEEMIEIIFDGAERLAAGFTLEM